MEVSVFIENIQKAFGEKVQLPFAFWYSDKQINDDLKKINGCFFKEFEKLIGGEPISLSADRIGCMGGKFYTGFSTMNEKMPMFVSSKEKYKKSSELVLDFIIRKSKNPAKPKQKVQNPTKIGRNHNSKRLSKYESRNIKRQKKSIGN